MGYGNGNTDGNGNYVCVFLSWITIGSSWHCLLSTLLGFGRGLPWRGKVAQCSDVLGKFEECCGSRSRKNEMQGQRVFLLQQR